MPISLSSSPCSPSWTPKPTSTTDGRRTRSQNEKAHWKVTSGPFVLLPKSEDPLICPVRPSFHSPVQPPLPVPRGISPTDEAHCSPGFPRCQIPGNLLISLPLANRLSSESVHSLTTKRISRSM